MYIYIYKAIILGIQFSSVTQSCPTLWDSMDCSTPGFPVHQQLPEFIQTHVHGVSDAIQPSHSLSSPSLAFNLSQHQGLYDWVSSSHQVAEVLELQLQHLSLWDISPERLIKSLYTQDNMRGSGHRGSHCCHSYWFRRGGRDASEPGWSGGPPTLSRERPLS